MNIKDEHWLETYRSLITISLEGFRYLALVNGGAIVALLAYLGDVQSNSSPVPGLRWAMGGFLVGLACWGGALLFSYITQLRVLNRRSHSISLYCAIVFYVASLKAFCVGAWCAVVAFT